MELAGSLESTATWAVAIVVTGLVLVSLLFEHMFHVLSHFLKKRKRKTLNQALNGVMTELRNLGFMSLLLTVARQPISKICIPGHVANTFLPCKSSKDPIFDEAPTCQEKGKVSLVSEVGVQQLQLLIFTLAVFHVVSCIATLGLGEAKMKKWKYWEEETRTMEYQLANVPQEEEEKDTESRTQRRNDRTEEFGIYVIITYRGKANKSDRVLWIARCSRAPSDVAYVDLIHIFSPFVVATHPPESISWRSSFDILYRYFTNSPFEKFLTNLESDSVRNLRQRM